MFFGALAFATSASFVGCKDYDDDIDAVNGRIDELAKSLSDLQTQVGGFVKSVDYNESTGVLTVVGADGKSHTYNVSKNLPSYTLEVTADGKVVLKKDGTAVSTGTLPSSFDPTKLTVATDGTVNYDGKATGVKVPTGGDGLMVAIKDGDTVVGYTISIGQESAKFYVVDAMPLKGLVFKPECYVGGIPSVQSSNVTYTKWTAGAYDMTKPTKIGETYSILAETKPSFITPQIWAYYHMNPASVSMDQVAAMSFISDDKAYYPVPSSRASVINPTANKEKSSVYTDADGQRFLKVAMDAKAELIPSENTVAVYALQVTTKKVGDNDAKVITSDYATIHKSTVTDLILKTHIGDADLALYGQAVSRADAVNTEAGKANEAITATADYKVATDETLNLATKIKTFCKIDGVAGEMKNVKDYGLKYIYTASNYITGDNETPQNEFFNMTDAKKGIVNPEYKGANAENTVGREPLIRVELVDTTKTTTQVVAVGWIKTEIVKGVTGGFGKEFPQGTYYYGCEDFTGSLTVINMNDVYKEAKMSKEDFHKAYKLDKDANGIVLAKGSTGKVTEKTDAGETTTYLLDWTVTPAQAFALSATTTDMFATVTYISEDGTRNNITITFKATIAMPSGAIGDAQKITQFWNSGKTAVNLDVKEPTATPATEFTRNLYNVFEGKKIVVDNVSESFTSFTADKQNSAFYFSAKNKDVEVTVGTDTYKLSMNDTRTELKATKGGVTQTIATITNVDAVTSNIKYEYETSDFAKVLLNKSAYNDKPFSAKIEIVVVNDCDEQLPLSNKEFDVKFLRPINIIDNKDAELQDATTGGASIDMSKLLSLSDWRGVAFTVTPTNFYTYYGVTGITINKATIMTNLNQTGDAMKLLKDVAPDIDVTYTSTIPTTAAGLLGNIVYKNGGHTVTSPYKLIIPVTVNYHFGSLTENVTLTITPTVGQK